MNFKDVTDRLSAEQKKRLRDAGTKEELDELFTGEKTELTDDQLDEAAGGAGCFRPKNTGPECPTCGMPVSSTTGTCPYCGTPIPQEQNSALNDPHTTPSRV